MLTDVDSRLTLLAEVQSFWFFFRLLFKGCPFPLLLCVCIYHDVLLNWNPISPPPDVSLRIRFMYMIKTLYKPIRFENIFWKTFLSLNRICSISHFKVNGTSTRTVNGNDRCPAAACWKWEFQPIKTSPLSQWRIMIGRSIISRIISTNHSSSRWVNQVCDLKHLGVAFFFLSNIFQETSPPWGAR